MLNAFSLLTLCDASIIALKLQLRFTYVCDSSYIACTPLGYNLGKDI